ncbi:MAG: hypothetical protein ABI835_09360 [Chloroflexota bacterium]
MTTQRQLTMHKFGLRDVAVDGLWRGALAGAAMAVYLVIATTALGDAPFSVLARFTSQDVAASPLGGALSHLAASAIYGALFTILWHLLARRSSQSGLALLGGVVYAGLLFVFSEYVLLPAVQSPLLGVPALHWGVAHLIYGLVLGVLTARGHRA